MSLFGKKPPPKPASASGTASATSRKPAVPTKAIAGRTSSRLGTSKEDKLREMIEKDPEQAAALLRQMFLRNK